VTETGEHQEADPVKQKGHNEGRDEHDVRAEQVVGGGQTIFRIAGIDGDERECRLGRSHSSGSIAQRIWRQ